MYVGFKRNNFPSKNIFDIPTWTGGSLNLMVRCIVSVSYQVVLLFNLMSMQMKTMYSLKYHKFGELVRLM